MTSRKRLCIAALVTLLLVTLASTCYFEHRRRVRLERRLWIIQQIALASGDQDKETALAEILQLARGGLLPAAQSGISDP
jgi:hypothetical protein